jgi:heat shock protein HslJ
MDELQGSWAITTLLPYETAPATAEITFDNGHLHFYAGCNRAMGGYTYDGRTLTAGPIALTMMYCPDMSAEQHLCRVLAEPLEVSIDDDTLMATGPAGGFTAQRDYSGMT